MAPSPYCCPCAYFIRSRILVITDPNADRNKIEISTLYSDEKIPVLCRKFPVHSKKFPVSLRREFGCKPLFVHKGRNRQNSLLISLAASGHQPSLSSRRICPVVK